MQETNLEEAFLDKETEVGTEWSANSDDGPQAREKVT